MRRRRPSNPPLTPQEYASPAPKKCKRINGGGKIPKGAQGEISKPVDSAFFETKLLMLEANFCRVGSIFPRVCCFFPRVCSFSPHCHFGLSLSLSLSNLLKRKENILIKAGDSEYISIHGSKLMVKKPSTGFLTHPRVFRGWIFTHFLNRNKNLSSVVKKPSTGDMWKIFADILFIYQCVIFLVWIYPRIFAFWHAPTPL